MYSEAAPAKVSSISPLEVIGVFVTARELPLVVTRPTEVTVPDVLEVPAPIKLLTSAALIPEFKLGVVPFDNIAGTPVSPTTVQFNVTEPLVPPPDIPVPATTLVISPCGIVGKDVTSPSPLI